MASTGATEAVLEVVASAVAIGVALAAVAGCGFARRLRRLVGAAVLAAVVPRFGVARRSRRLAAAAVPGLVGVFGLAGFCEVLASTSATGTVLELAGCSGIVKRSPVVPVGALVGVMGSASVARGLSTEVVARVGVFSTGEPALGVGSLSSPSLSASSLIGDTGATGAESETDAARKRRWVN